MGLLNKATDTAPYMRLKTKIDELKSDPRYQFMFSGMLIADYDDRLHLQDLPPARAGQADLDLDVSGVPSDIVSVVVAVLSRLVFDYAIWSRNEVAAPDPPGLRGSPPLRPGRQDLGRPGGAEGAGADRQGGPQIWRLARPDHPASVGSGRRRAVAMRHDDRHAPEQRPRPGVRNAMPEGSRGFLDVIPALRNRECIVCGEGVSIPIRVSFDDLERERRPASSDPLFSDLWRQTGDEEASSAASSSAGAPRGAERASPPLDPAPAADDGTRYMPARRAARARRAPAGLRAACRLCAPRRPACRACCAGGRGSWPGRRRKPGAAEKRTERGLTARRCDRSRNGGAGRSKGRSSRYSRSPGPAGPAPRRDRDPAHMRIAGGEAAGMVEPHLAAIAAGPAGAADPAVRRRRGSACRRRRGNRGRGACAHSPGSDACCRP